MACLMYVLIVCWGRGGTSLNCLPNQAVKGGIIFQKPVNWERNNINGATTKISSS